MKCGDNNIITLEELMDWDDKCNVLFKSTDDMQRKQRAAEKGK